MDFTVEQIEFLKGPDGLKILNDNGIITTNEVEKIVPAQITEEDKANILKGFLKSKLNIADDVDINNIALTTVDSSNAKIDSIKKGIVNKMISEKVKHFDLIGGKVDYNKIEIEETGIKGLDEQLEGLKAQYPDLFIGTETKKNDPPLPGGDPQKTKVTYEQFQNMSKAEKAKLTTEQLKEIMMN